WKYSRPARHAEVARKYSKLIEHCVTEHDALAAEAGATGFVRRTGWLKVFRTERERDRRFAEAGRWKEEVGITSKFLLPPELQKMDPHVAPVLAGAIHWTQPVAVDDPQGLALAYLERFKQLGGVFLQGNAASLLEESNEWVLLTSRGKIVSQKAVIAL